MQNAVQFIAFLALAYGAAIVTWPLLRLARFPFWLVICIAAAIMLTPLAIGPTHVTLRALASVLAIDLFFKITDYGTQQRPSPGTTRSFDAYLRFLVPFPVLLVRYSDRPSRSRVKLQGGWSTTFASVGFGFCCILLAGLSDASALETSFVLDHTIKFVLFAVAIELLSRVILGVEQIAGYRTEPIVNNAFRSQTVAEFWYRYNTRVHAWFKHKVFPLLNGKRAPVRAVTLTFFVSGLLHELGFAIATSRLDGYQFAFFVLQAPAVILGNLVHRMTNGNHAGRFALRCSTIVWFWATSMLFFHGVDRVFPLFYASTPWLP